MAEWLTGKCSLCQSCANWHEPRRKPALSGASSPLATTHSRLTDDYLTCCRGAILLTEANLELVESMAMPAAVLIPLSALLCCVIIISGVLQCFAPAKLKRLQDKVRPHHVNCSESAGGVFLERLREKQARSPSLLYRLSGFMLMGAGVLGLLFVLGLIH